MGQFQGSGIAHAPLLICLTGTINGLVVFTPVLFLLWQMKMSDTCTQQAPGVHRCLPLCVMFVHAHPCGICIPHTQTYTLSSVRIEFGQCDYCMVLDYDKNSL